MNNWLIASKQLTRQSVTLASPIEQHNQFPYTANTIRARINMGQKQSVTSQTNGDISALAKDLKLNGKELETPRMYPVDWKAGQMFTEEEDPDRMKGSDILFLKHVCSILRQASNSVQ